MADWVTGDSICFTTAGWVYGETLCFTTEETVKPTEAWIRVTNLVHSWIPGSYLLTIGLGELTTEFAIPDIIRRERPSWMEPPPGPTPPPGLVAAPEGCTVGEAKCIGAHMYQCVRFPIPGVGVQYWWWLTEANSPQCGGIPT